MNNQPLQGQQQISPDLIKQGTIRKCECGSILFDTTTSIIKLSKLISPNGEDLELPIRVLVCRSCGVVPEWSDPDNLLPSNIKTNESNEE